MFYRPNWRVSCFILFFSPTLWKVHIMWELSILLRWKRLASESIYNWSQQWPPPFCLFRWEELFLENFLNFFLLLWSGFPLFFYFLYHIYLSCIFLQKIIHFTEVFKSLAYSYMVLYFKILSQICYDDFLLSNLIPLPSFSKNLMLFC